MGRYNKIAYLNLEPVIMQLQGDGVKRSKDIAAHLRQMGHSISQPTVSRWLKEQRETKIEETQKLVRDHVQKVIPVDLDALEEMELQCLTLAREEKGDFSHRLAWQNIEKNLDVWLDIFNQF
jgi:predicted transcriptional regulator